MKPLSKGGNLDLILKLVSSPLFHVDILCDECLAVRVLMLKQGV